MFILMHMSVFFAFSAEFVEGYTAGRDSVIYRDECNVVLSGPKSLFAVKNKYNGA